MLACLCVLGLARVGYGQTDRVSQLISKLNDPAACGNRVEVAEQLGLIKDPRAVEPLITALKDKDGGVGRFAAEALGEIRDPRAVEPLIATFEDPNEYEGVRDAAAMALGYLGDRRAIQPLTAALSDPLLGRVARQALGYISDPPPRHPTETFARAPRKIDANFAWPSWLPEYAGWYGARYSLRVVYLDFGNHRNYRYENALQSNDEGSFAFNAPRVDVCDTDVGVASSVMTFYEDKFKALGMTVTREERGVGPVPGVVAADARRSVIVYPNGGSMSSGPFPEPPGLGLTIEVEYAPCASIADGKVVINPKVSDTNMHAAEIPCALK